LIENPIEEWYFSKKTTSQLVQILSEVAILFLWLKDFTRHNP